MDKIFETVFGSHLYDLNTPESDEDFKGVFLLPLRDIVWSGPEKVVKENEEDVDRDYYSLTKFLKMACKNDMVSFDMLHAPREAWAMTSPYWEVLVENRAGFYSQRMNNTLGLARSCVHRYYQSKLVKPKDWSHALRLCYQWESIALEGSYSFPVTGAERQLLLDMKLGRVSHGECSSFVDQKLKDAEKAIDESGLPEKPDMEFVRNFLHDVYHRSS